MSFPQKIIVWYSPCHFETLEVDVQCQELKKSPKKQSKTENAANTPTRRLADDYIQRNT